MSGKIYIYLLRVHHKKDQKRTYLIMLMRFFSDFLYKEVKKKKYTGCNMKTTEFLDCVLIGVCFVIRSNTVYTFTKLLIENSVKEMDCQLANNAISDTTGE